MKPILKLLILFSILSVLFLIVLFRSQKPTEAIWCPPIDPCEIDCGTQCCNDGANSCSQNQKCCYCGCKLNCDCCAPTNGVWSACSTTTLTQTCGTASSCGTQVCTPAGGTQQCCVVAGTCSLSANYSTSVTITGCANGTLTISGGTTTVNNGHTFNFGVLAVTTGYIAVPGTGTIRTNSVCN